MATADLFRRSIEVATSFFDMSRERAETVVKEWVDAGELGRGTAHKAVEDLLQLSRKGREELTALVRREVRNQLAALGVATKDDVARIEAKLESGARPGPVPGAGKAPATGTRTAKQPQAKRPAATSAPAGEAPAKARRSTKGAPVTKSATARKRSGPAKAAPGS